MIDDKELEARAEAYALDAWGEGDETLEGDSELTRGDEREFCERDFIAGARSQDELAYQRGRQEVLDIVLNQAIEASIVNEMDPTDNEDNYLIFVCELKQIIDQLRTEVKG